MLSVSYLNFTQKIKGFGSETRQLYPFEIFHDRGFHPFLLFVRVSHRYTLSLLRRRCYAPINVRPAGGEAGQGGGI